MIWRLLTPIFPLHIVLEQSHNVFHLWTDLHPKHVKGQQYLDIQVKIGVQIVKLMVINVFTIFLLL